MTRTPASTRRAATIDRHKNDKGLGRKVSPDDRDRAFPLRAVMLARGAVARALPTSKTWPLVTGVLDQGSTPRCVAFAWTQFLFATPLSHKAGELGAISTFAGNLYKRAQQIDEWPGENYDGTSVRAGAKVLVEQGRIARVADVSETGGYRWAANAAEARDYVLGVGPLVFGTDWYDEMFEPTADGYLIPAGSVAGGHAYLVIGFSKSRNAFRIVNSWGAAWGEKGRAWIKFADADKLIQEYGEACSAVEIRPGA